MDAKHTSTRHPSRWMFWHRSRAADDLEADARVELWKATWLKGAQSAWQQSSASNPYASGLERSAWNAGWRWAQEHPDRRAREVSRLAHPRRRAGDRTVQGSLKRAAAIGATGLTVLAISTAVRRWMKHQRPERMD
jgi:hypothetical protein